MRNAPSKGVENLRPMGYNGKYGLLGIDTWLFV